MTVLIVTCLIASQSRIDLSLCLGLSSQELTLSQPVVARAGAGAVAFRLVGRHACGKVQQVGHKRRTGLCMVPTREASGAGVWLNLPRSGHGQALRRQRKALGFADTLRNASSKAAHLC